MTASPSVNPRETVQALHGLVDGVHKEACFSILDDFTAGTEIHGDHRHTGGIGFSQDYAEQIFGLFKRLNDRLIYPGSGIGLALCKKVVENHNGAIFAKSSEQEGASFYIYLPVRQG